MARIGESEEVSGQFMDIRIDVHQNLRRLGGVSRLLVSPKLHGIFTEEFRSRWNEYRRRKQDVPPSGELFFMGIPVVECELLSGLEYALAMGGGRDDE